MTGHIYLVGNNVNVVAYNIDLVGSRFTVNTGDQPYATLTGSGRTTQSWSLLQAGGTHLAENVAYRRGPEHFGVGQYYDLTLAGGNLWSGADPSDLSLDYGDGNFTDQIGQVVGVPEPGGSGLIALVAARWLTKRRRAKPKRRGTG